jgi:hypothetical protein
MAELNPKNVRIMVNRLEKTAGRIEKEFERQLKALDQARDAMQREARKQLDSIRREQRGFLTRVRQAARPSTKTRAKKTTAKRAPARKRSQARRATARTSTRRRAA